MVLKLYQHLTCQVINKFSIWMATKSSRALNSTTSFKVLMCSKTASQSLCTWKYSIWTQITCISLTATVLKCSRLSANWSSSTSRTIKNGSPGYQTSKLKHGPYTISHGIWTKVFKSTSTMRYLILINLKSLF